MPVEELIQLMRLSGTGRVRDYLVKLKKAADAHPDSRSAVIYSGLIDMFKTCRRADKSEAWPSDIS